MYKEIKKQDGEKILFDVADIAYIERQHCIKVDMLVIGINGKHIVIEDDNGALYEEIKSLMCKYDDIVE